MEMKRGRFFVLEGTDGTGKATQTELLVSKLRKEGFEAAVFDFPQYGENVFALSVGAILREEYGKIDDMNPYLASFAYAGDRAKAAPKIKECLDKGMIVVSNRYTSANMGHQGGKIKDKVERRKFLDWLKDLEFGEKGYGIPEPDMVLLLYLDPKVGQELVAKKAARDYTQGEKRDAAESNFQHLSESARAFLEISYEEENWMTIHCGDKINGGILPKEKISDMIWDAVKDKIGN
jgi:dTMP kinase